MTDGGRTLQPQDFGIGRLFWHIREAVVVGDADTGRIVLWNRAAEALFGYTTTEASGCPIEMLIPEHLRDRHRAGLARFRETGQGNLVDSDRGAELPALHKSGRSLTIELLLSPIDEATVPGRFVLAVIRDATERKLAEDRRVELAREQAARAEADAARPRLALLADARSVLASSLEWETTLANVARLVVPERADWCVVDIVQDDGRVRPVEVAAGDPSVEPLLLELVARNRQSPGWEHHPAAVALRTGESQLLSEVPDADLVAIARDDQHLALIMRHRPRSTISVPLRSRGRTLGVITFLSTEGRPRYTAGDLDFAEELGRRAATAIEHALLFKQAREAIRGRDEFLSIAAHELKTPMTSLLGHVQILSRRLDTGAPHDPARARRGLQIVTDQAWKLSRLIEQLLDVSRLESGKLRIERQRVDLGRFVRPIAEAARGRTEQHTITVQGDPEVSALLDPLRIEQVLVNLLDNAIKYSPDGGPIDVEYARLESGGVRIVVADRGLGIPPEHRESIFDRFYQAHSAEHVSGMGLGLYVSQEIVSLHGGQLAAEERAGGGTRFVITLPSVMTTEAAATGPAS